MKPRPFVLAAIVLLAVVIFLMPYLPGPGGVVASLRLPDGGEYMVTQQCNWSTEPYTISFYMKSPGGAWGWCYLDHQATRWSNVKMTYDHLADVITITKWGVWQASLNRRAMTFAIGDGKPKRELAAPQELRQPPFAFP